jgi:peptidyl-prolyl cis-trans isomerase B (cyclophilin B)
LASQGFFDDTRCHRLVTSGIYVLQCGDPSYSGSGGPGYSFADELSGKEQYGTGTLAMANAGPDTNGSQFFIVFKNSPLPPSYTVFGTIDAQGLAAVKKVAAAGTDNAFGANDGHPNTEVQIDSVTAAD